MSAEDYQYGFLGRVYVNFKRAEVAYKLYLENGKKYLFAKILRKSNGNILAELTNNSYLLSDQLMKDSLELISHFDIWIEYWDNLETQLKPSIDDEFVFQNEFNFPKQSAENMIEEYLRLRIIKNKK